MNFTSFRISKRGYTVYKMSPITATRIMGAIDLKKKPDRNRACIKAMCKSIALAIAGSRNPFSKLRSWLLMQRFEKHASFDDLFRAYHNILCMLPLEDIAAVAAIMEQLSLTISKDRE